MAKRVRPEVSFLWHESSGRRRLGRALLSMRNLVTEEMERLDAVMPTATLKIGEDPFSFTGNRYEFLLEVPPPIKHRDIIDMALAEIPCTLKADGFSSVAGGVNDSYLKMTLNIYGDYETEKILRVAKWFEVFNVTIIHCKKVGGDGTPMRIL